MSIQILHRHIRTSTTLILLSLLLSGISSCTMLNPPVTTYITPPLEYYSWLAAAPETALEQEHRRLNQAGTEDIPLITAVQRAMLLSVPAQATDTDLKQAIALLEVQTADDEVIAGLPELYHVFATLWLKQLQLDQHLQSAKAAQTGRQQQIKLLEDENSELKATIEAFTNIEQQLIQRELNQGQP